MALVEDATKRLPCELELKTLCEGNSQRKLCVAAARGRGIGTAKTSYRWQILNLGMLFSTK
ncbi:hypothetical protein SAMN05444169_5006 [Bradyrhizobium erythrophlei]|uniref:Uncharacterized protein n=1 Tax=Bradyrhizobium erythrophlei TaxID=1437360 RepID=A0A1M5P3L5_9BRAD|nr:hypothetical protein SAMN05444169_5006 [Bradyrhizobium erythrophlei]